MRLRRVGFWKTIDCLFLIALLIVSPLKLKEPVEGVINPWIIRKNILFPDPFGPIITDIVLLLILKLIFDIRLRVGVLKAKLLIWIGSKLFFFVLTQLDIGFITCIIFDKRAQKIN